ncbi:hypothetical protein PVAP13_5NG181481 [Panicum virgatum]|uniref:Uncharacterized protein n=1 Tax=Panicum virgatum TaxID=38727 RepID=A0A8T0RNI4_PANVG|nr:hypothetical protein PVAP13_5NG181481 [Panicum virgatum]
MDSKQQNGNENKIADLFVANRRSQTFELSNWQKALPRLVLFFCLRFISWRRPCEATIPSLPRFPVRPRAPAPPPDIAPSSPIPTPPLPHERRRPCPYPAPSPRAPATLQSWRPCLHRSVVALPAGVLADAVAPDPCNHATARDCAASTDPWPPPAIGRAFTITITVAVAFVAMDGATPHCSIPGQELINSRSPGSAFLLRSIASLRTPILAIDLPGCLLFLQYRG